MIFIATVLLTATIIPFNGTNPRSVVIMDNASIHHVEPAVQLIEEHGVILHFLPLYTSWIWIPLRKPFQRLSISYDPCNDPVFQVCQDSDIKDAILKGFATITPNDCYEGCLYSLDWTTGLTFCH